MKRKIYEYMCGELVEDQLPEDVQKVVKDEFAQGEALCELGQRVYELKNEISTRLGTEEDAAVEELVAAMDEINRHMCEQMYEYGRLFGNRDN